MFEFVYDAMFVCDGCRHHTFKWVDKELKLTEVGPRFDMKCKYSRLRLVSRLLLSLITFIYIHIALFSLCLRCF